MVRASVLLILIFLLTTSWRVCAEETPPAATTPDLPARIAAHLATLTTERDSPAKVEEALVAEGPVLLPALRQTLTQTARRAGQGADRHRTTGYQHQHRYTRRRDHPPELGMAGRPIELPSGLLA